jgi:hypothetical protein
MDVIILVYTMGQLFSSDINMIGLYIFHFIIPVGGDLSRVIFLQDPSYLQQYGLSKEHILTSPQL